MKLPACCTALLVLVSAGTSAQDLDSTFRITPYVNLHSYTWKEFSVTGPAVTDDGATVEESGARFAFGVLSRGNYFLQNKDLFLETDLRYTRGTVDYNGSTFDLQTGRTVGLLKDQTRYWDIEATASVGRNIQLSDILRLTPVAGFGYLHWNRAVQPDNPNGVVENYSVFLGTIGANGTYTASDRVQLLLGLLLKLPFTLSETYDSAQVQNHVSPGKNPRIVVDLGANVGRVFAAFEIEKWTLSESEASAGLLQPKSTRSEVGLKVGYRYAFGGK